MPSLQDRVKNDRTDWSAGSRESTIERFYSHGVSRYGEFHSGYLNFGLWDPGIQTYLEAAENLIRRMGTLLGLNEESRLLDVACGMGTQDLYLMRTFRPAHIDALDVTWGHIIHARGRIQSAHLENRITAHHGTATNLPFPNASFTQAMCIEGAEFFNTREAFMREAYRVLVPRGVLALADYTLKRPPRTILEKIVLAACLALWKIPKENVDTKERFYEKLSRSGFVNITIEEVGTRTIPGYYFEQKRPEVRASLSRIRGFIAGRLGFIIDIFLYQAFIRGLIEYVLVRAEKPA